MRVTTVGIGVLTVRLLGLYLLYHTIPDILLLKHNFVLLMQAYEQGWVNVPYQLRELGGTFFSIGMTATLLIWAPGIVWKIIGRKNDISPRATDSVTYRHLCQLAVGLAGLHMLVHGFTNLYVQFDLLSQAKFMSRIPGVAKYAPVNRQLAFVYGAVLQVFLGFVLFLFSRRVTIFWFSLQIGRRRQKSNY